MPLYSFSCEKCGHANDEFAAMQNAVPVGVRVQCPQCGQPAYRRLISVPSGGMERGYFSPIEMYSIALDNDAEIADFKRRCTSSEIDMATDPNDPMYGIPIARNRRQKLAALDAAGFVERK